ncbi:hypothetical protein AWB78_04941 [Caballeronia calidae]|uniref:Uncharacterized protein n=1 Tax=Caballeronia calidae TaxID=1777139 RepID=A0A158DCR9_9BURK|nr:hypothetical protein [Caballeronia calidae]SAK91617.1 hypothetical protein AWB78_04941 [Caballeronia calidae]
MDQFDNYTKLDCRCQSAMTSKVSQLLEFLIADAMTDIEVVAKELGLEDEMRDRLRRSLDELACAQTVVEAMRIGFAVDAPDDGSREEVNPMESILRAMITLATRWPQNYGADAVEWLVLGELHY